MKHILAVLLMLLPLSALAEGSHPALYDVIGVASDDVLNIRTEPSAATPIIGALAFDQTDVEVIRLADGGTWARVNTNERAGWVSMRFLTRQPGQDWGDIPAALNCSGTEPFWGFDIPLVGPAILSTPQSASEFNVLGRIPGAARPDRFAFEAERGIEWLTAIVAVEACNDGMSDRDYGFGVDLLLATQGVLYSGCCSLAR